VCTYAWLVVNSTARLHTNVVDSRRSYGLILVSSQLQQHINCDSRAHSESFGTKIRSELITQCLLVQSFTLDHASVDPWRRSCHTDFTQVILCYWLLLANRPRPITARLAISPASSVCSYAWLVVNSMYTHLRFSTAIVSSLLD